jgi:uncharacterized protein
MRCAPRPRPLLSADLTITRSQSAAAGCYSVQIGTDEAVLEYRVIGPGQIDAYRTFVPPVFRGSGVALALVARLVADARAEGMQIIPSCSYVAVQRDRHRDWADAFAPKD